MFIPPYIMVRVVAIIISIALFAAMHTDRKEMKYILSKGTSLLTTFFVVFMGAKLLTTFPMILEYPVAVLSYPSGTLEFYIGVGAMLIHAYRLSAGKDELYGMVVLLSGAFFFYYIISTVVMNDRPLEELVLWFIIYIGSFLWKRYWPIFLEAGMLVAGLLSLNGPVLDVMGIPVDAGFYIVAAAGIFIIDRRVYKWKRT
ncbi:hypothetical protein [Salimicrobium halophilum]|uniref:Uncharacterized protein n=1 Tax=Salimicrobium halophilum TaxID=86666 RepID=A0A1G8SY38_9BACI|nr:hypothetical protein [Salimicrobium halophilum]SDJ34171.1 hypothetical protein SAMN04490247_1592 [Salimicrobium halophilum]